MKKQYIVTKSEIEQQLTNHITLALFVRLFSGRYSEIEQDKLPSALGMAKGTFNKAWKELIKFGYVVCSESSWTITDTPDALTNDSATLGGLFEQDNKLLDWLNKECPRVQRMQQPITYKQAVELLERFPTEPEKKALRKTFKDMENHRPLHNKYVSAKSTVDNWIQKNLDKLPINPERQNYVPTA